MSVADELRALAAHYPMSHREPDDEARWLADYASDLREFDPEIVRRACFTWRQSMATRFPTPGQMRVECRKLKPREDGPIARWREVSDEEYQRMTLADKIIHRRILANECDGKAGPMWINGMEGRALRPEEMSDEWHFWRERGKAHRAEAKRLSDMVKDMERPERKTTTQGPRTFQDFLR